MNGLVMMLLAVVILGGAYLIYGRYLAKKWGVDPDAKTPAYEMEDGVDYVPADTNVVFGHQFASIAGAGPINGPIQAAMFGWLPVMRMAYIRMPVCDCCLRDPCMGPASAQGLSEQLPASGHDYRCGTGNLCL